MVRITADYRSQSIQDALESILVYHAARIAEKRLVIELDIAQGMKGIVCIDSLYNTMERLVVLAIERCPRGSDLAITILHTVRGVEIEIADSGTEPNSDGQMSRFSAFAPQKMRLLPGRAFGQDPRIEVGAGCDLFCTRCPQGGLAWTVVMRQSAEAVRAA